MDTHISICCLSTHLDKEHPTPPQPHSPQASTLFLCLHLDEAELLSLHLDADTLVREKLPEKLVDLIHFAILGGF